MQCRRHAQLWYMMLPLIYMKSYWIHMMLFACVSNSPVKQCERNNADRLRTTLQHHNPQFLMKTMCAYHEAISWAMLEADNEDVFVCVWLCAVTWTAATYTFSQFYGMQRVARCLRCTTNFASAALVTNMHWILQLLYDDHVLLHSAKISVRSGKKNVCVHGCNCKLQYLQSCHPYKEKKAIAQKAAQIRPTQVVLWSTVSVVLPLAIVASERFRLEKAFFAVERSRKCTE